MNQKDKARCYDWLRLRLLVSQISGQHIVPGHPLHMVPPREEEYAKLVDQAVLKELAK